jgi:hypothetical protein
MEYLGKKQLQQYKDEISAIIEDLKIELGNEWYLYYYLVGSGRRNMVLESNEGFDLDYHLMLKKWPNNLDAEGIKMAMMNALDEVTLGHLSSSKDSTHVITIKCVENGTLKYSYDLAIMKKDNSSQILKNEKENGNNGPYHFVQVPDSSSFFDKFSNIKGPKMWRDLRDFYKEEKVEQHKVKKEDRIYSFALLQSATNRVLQKYDLI